MNRSGQIIGTAHVFWAPNDGLVRDIPLFHENLGWWNIIIWPDRYQELPIAPKAHHFGQLYIHVRFWGCMYVCLLVRSFLCLASKAPALIEHVFCRSDLVKSIRNVSGPYNSILWVLQGTWRPWLLVVRDRGKRAGRKSELVDGFWWNDFLIYLLEPPFTWTVFSLWIQTPPRVPSPIPKIGLIG